MRVGQRLGQVAAEFTRGIEVIERLGNQQIGIGIEILGELVALIAQVRFDFKVDAEVELILPVAQFAAEFLGHVVVRQVGDMADHACHAQAVFRYHAVRVKIAAMKIRIGQNRLACDIIERDILR